MVAIDTLFPLAKKVEIGAVDDLDFHGGKIVKSVGNRQLTVGNGMDKSRRFRLSILKNQVIERGHGLKMKENFDAQFLCSAAYALGLSQGAD